MFYQVGVIAVCLCMFGLVHAGLIPVGDHSFESAGLGASGWTNGPHGTWTEDNDGSNGSFIEHLTGFAAEGNHHLGINSLPTSIAGGVVPPGTFQYSVFQDIGVALQPNTKYTLTVAIGNRNATFNPAGGLAAFGVEVVGGSALATGTFDAFNLAEGTFADQSVSFTTNATPVAGNIVIKLANIDVGLAQNLPGIGARSHFDNVRLKANAIPEPSALAFLTTIGLGLVLLRRRK